MENENRSRISGAESVLDYAARKTNSNISGTASLIREAPALMADIQKAIDDYNKNLEVANNVVNSAANKTPIDLVGKLKRDAENESYSKYQEARNER